MKNRSSLSFTGAAIAVIGPVMLFLSLANETIAIENIGLSEEQ
jgi:hypothetical protein